MANEEDLGLAGRRVFGVEVLKKFVELFPLFVYEEFEGLVIFDGESVTPRVDPG